MNQNFLHDIKNRTGGQEWLDNIPNLLTYFEKDWNLKIGKPYDLSYNYVAPATRNTGDKLVIKIDFPGNEGYLSEVAALKLFNGEGSINLISSNDENMTMLLEQAVPGKRLNKLSEDETQTKILASIIKRISRKVPEKHDFKLVSELSSHIPKYKKRFSGSNNPLSLYLLDKTEFMLNGLISSTSNIVVMHGDLHQGNILSSDREGWLAIDPNGIVGDPCFETGAMMRNPYPTLAKKTNLKEILIKRIEILADELNFERNRILQWSFVQTMLSIIYRIEDHGDTAWHSPMKVAEVLDEIKYN